MAMPAVTFGQIYYDQDGIARDHMQGDGSYRFYDSVGQEAGSARPNYSGGWTFYDRYGVEVGSEDGH